ncbi:MAG: hypothetical protein HY722_13520 [Planctomycetes bacterium]|nr:hypothetical protein [Planctomycetota bacterium]
MNLRRRVNPVALALLAVAAQGCAISPVIAPTGVLYSSYRAPIDVDFMDTAVSDKMGSSAAHCVLGLVSWGDASAYAAARNGGLSTIEDAEYDYLNVLFVYQRYTLVVRGK